LLTVSGVFFMAIDATTQVAAFTAYPSLLDAGKIDYTLQAYSKTWAIEEYPGALKPLHSPAKR
jgi:hypothetical protein